MSKEKKNTWTPKLRFPEFREAGEWVEKQLGEIGRFTGGGTPSKNNESYWKGSIPWVSSSDIFEDSIHQINISRFITDEALKDSAAKMVPANSILLVSRVGVGKLAITLQPVSTSQDFTNFTPTNDNLTFLAYYLKAYSNVLLQVSQGMAIKGFTKDDISKLGLALPPSPEQQKIAQTLTTLDALITAQNQQLAALQAHKKGLMQQLFPAEGERVPRVRFGEFEGEWEEKALGELGNVLMCKRIFAEQTSEKGDVPFYKIGTLGGKPDAFINRILFEEYKSKYNYPRKGEILITCSGTVGKCLPYDGKDAYTHRKVVCEKLA